jgi:cob(I)alamin adenosyltransferase
MKEKKRKEKTGLVQVYTGNGKGKTTAALGLALRAAGSNMRTYIGQFLKGRQYGELESIKHLSPLITIEQYGINGWVHVDEATPDQKAAARNGLIKATKAIMSEKYDIVVLDEINIAIFFGVLPEQEVLDLLDIKPDSVELILTGRNAPQSLIERADLVTEMKEIKHPFKKGVQARQGIEY